MKAKKLLTAALAGLFAFGAFTVDMQDTQAATRAELGAIKVSKRGNFQYWEKDSVAKKQLVDYVKDVTNKNSKNFIPVEDRIAVFDPDGTLICETAPYYFEWMFYIHHDLNDPNNHPSFAARQTARDILDAIHAHKMTLDLDEAERYGQAASFEGFTPEEYAAYVKNYMNTTYVEGLSNLKTGEGFYMPMVEVVSYLNANKFTVYIVSGSERDLLRVLVDGVMDIEPNHIIGTDHTYTTANIGDNRPDRFFLKPDDQLLRGGDLLELRLQTNKVYAIKREIGKQPVLAFGNSTGDASMFTYTITNNKYKSAAFMIMCDDVERELGSQAKADKCYALVKEYGWIPISMRDDWSTIYGSNVKPTK